MTTNNLTMRVEQLNGTASIIHIQGDITAAAENKLMEAYSQASQNGTKGIILDFNHLDYMNSSGIGLLVTLLIRAKRQGQKLLAVGLSEHYQQIFELTRLNEAIAIHETAAVARATLG
ncbi:MAG: STAS domain-containing protein [Candidatus Promineifilaceae bacterium]